jgi:hypothetical protein
VSVSGDLMQIVPDGWRGSAKAIVAAVTAGITYLLGIIPASGGFGDVNTVGWLGFVLAVLGPGAVVWAVPNRTRAEKADVVDNVIVSTTEASPAPEIPAETQET